MPYSRSRKTVERMKHILDDLVQTRESVTLIHPEPHKLAYQIHDAIHASQYHQGFEMYRVLNDKFKFRIKPAKLVCELRDRAAIEVVREKMAKMVFEDMTVLNEIVGAVVSNKPEEAYFPSATLTYPDLEKLYKWASQNGYHIISHDDAGLTLTKNHTELAWVPNAEAS